MIRACVQFASWFHSALRVGLPLKRGTHGVLLLGLLILLTWPTATHGQVAARIKGTVTDQSGASVPSATVTATDTETGVSRSVTTEADGTYLILALPVGLYDLTASKSGFQDSIHSGINLNISQEVTIDVRLQLG